MEDYINNEIQALMEAVGGIANLDDDKLDEMLPLMQQQIAENYTPELKEKSINQLITDLENQRLTREEARVSLEVAKEALDDLLNLDDLTDKQRLSVKTLLQPLYDTFDEGLKRFHNYSIELPVKLEEDAKIPTYAHGTDACADLYALENVTIKANTYGNKIRTGVSIQLPEGWLAMIFPRSSIGAKTPFRLSNSVGIIDSGYRGELGVLFDNTSDNDTTINKGDRIAQLLVMPSYRFMPKVVDILENSDRGEGGFGSTGT